MRMHELAKELGMTNAEIMELAGAMGVPAKSHSSTILEQQADRLRRRAERDGLTRDQQPEEAKPAKRTTKKAAAKPADADEGGALKAGAAKAKAAQAASTPDASTEEPAPAPAP